MNDSNAKQSEDLTHLNRTSEKPEESLRNPKWLLVRIFVSALICFCVPAFSIPSPASIGLLLCAGLVSGVDLIMSGVKSVMQEDYFHKNAVITLIFIVSFCVGVGYEGALLMILTQVGILLSDYITRQVEDQLLGMTGLEFETANEVVHGKTVERFLDEVQPGSEIDVMPGERFPLDCMVMDGVSVVDSSPVTGQTKPRNVTAGDTVLAGTINLSQPLRCEVLCEEGESTADEILHILKYGSRTPEDLPIGKVFTPALMAVSVAFAIILAVSGSVDAYEAIHRALALFTLSSALPAFSGIRNIRFAARVGAASRGVIFTDDHALERTASSHAAVLSAEGILTAGHQKVVRVESEQMDAQTILKIAAHAVAFSKDPNAGVIIEAYGGPIYIELVEEFVEIPNCGVKVQFEGVPVVLGTQALMAAAGNVPVSNAPDQEILYLTVGHALVGTITLSDPVRKSSSALRETLEEQGIRQLSFVTSYAAPVAEKISQRSGIDTYQANCGNDGKLRMVEQIKEETPDCLLYMCDEKRYQGTHSSADIDVVIGKRPDSTAKTADVILPGERPATIVNGLSAAYVARKMCRLSGISVFSVKAVLIGLAAFGLTTVWFSAFVELAVTLGIQVFSCQAFYERPFHDLLRSNKSQNES